MRLILDDHFFASRTIVMSKIFDLGAANDFLKSQGQGHLQANVAALAKKYGKHFKIKYKKLVVPVVLMRRTSLANGSSHWILFYEEDANRTTYLRPFMISFFDLFDQTSKTDVVYIENIHRTDKISGSDMVRLVLEINRVLGAKTARIYDGTRVDCGKDVKMDLSFLKLIETGATFYMKFGFKFDAKPEHVLGQNAFRSDKDMVREVEWLISNIRRIKVADIRREYELYLEILNKVVVNQDVDKLKLLVIWRMGYNISNEFFKKIEMSEIGKLFSECVFMLEVLNSTKQTLLYKLLIDLFNDEKECAKYSDVVENLSNSIEQISYRRLKIEREYVAWFAELKYFRDSYSYKYEF